MSGVTQCRVESRVEVRRTTSAFSGTVLLQQQLEPAHRTKQVSLQLPTSADNVTLLAFAAERRAAVRRAAGCRPLSIDISSGVLLKLEVGIRKRAWQRA